MALKRFYTGVPKFGETLYQVPPNKSAVVSLLMSKVYYKPAENGGGRYTGGATLDLGLQGTGDGSDYVADYAYQNTEEYWDDWESGRFHPRWWRRLSNGYLYNNAQVSKDNGSTVHYEVPIEAGTTNTYNYLFMVPSESGEEYLFEFDYSTKRIYCLDLAATPIVRHDRYIALSDSGNNSDKTDKGYYYPHNITGYIRSDNTCLLLRDNIKYLCSFSFADLIATGVSAVPLLTDTVQINSSTQFDDNSAVRILLEGDGNDLYLTGEQYLLKLDKSDPSHAGVLQSSASDGDGYNSAYLSSNASRPVAWCYGANKREALAIRKGTSSTTPDELVYISPVTGYLGAKKVNTDAINPPTESYHACMLAVWYNAGYYYVSTYRGVYRTASIANPAWELSHAVPDDPFNRTAPDGMYKATPPTPDPNVFLGSFYFSPVGTTKTYLPSHGITTYKKVDIHGVLSDIKPYLYISESTNFVNKITGLVLNSGDKLVSLASGTAASCNLVIEGIEEDA